MTENLLIDHTTWKFPDVLQWKKLFCLWILAKVAQLSVISKTVSKPKRVSNNVTVLCAEIIFKMCLCFL